MDHLKVITTAQDLLRQLQEQETVARFSEALDTLAELFQHQAALVAKLDLIDNDVRRAEAESGSRLQKCDQREARAQDQHRAATEARQKELATLDERCHRLLTEIGDLTTDRQRERDGLQQDQKDHAEGLVDMARERTAATQALEAVRASLVKLREAIPA